MNILKSIKLGFMIGEEACKAGLEDTMEWNTIEIIAEEAELPLSEINRKIIGKSIDVGYVVQEHKERRGKR